MLIAVINCFSQQNECYQLAKSYSSIQYFYPNPSLKELDWDKFLIHQVDQVLKENFDLEEAIKELCPEVSFQNSYNNKERLLAPSVLSENHYYQHFGGIETQNGDSKDVLMKSLITGSDLKSFSMLFKLIPMSKSIGHNIKIGFYAKWKSNAKGKALVTLNAGFKEKGKMQSLHHRVYIYPDDEWKYYELDTIFCKECPTKIFNALKIIRPDNDTLLIDDLMIIDTDAKDTLFYHGFENYDYKYDQYNEYESCLLSESIRPRPSTDHVKGEYSMQLIGNNHLNLYPQTVLDSFIQVSLGTDYFIEFPRFLNRSNSFDFDEIVAKYNSIEIDNYEKTTIYIADIIKLWTTLEQSYPYPEIKNKIDAFELLKTCTNKVRQANYNATAHYHNIVYLHSAYRDPHLKTFWNNKTPKKPPIIPQWIDGVYRVGLIYDEKYNSYFGREITHVNGQKIEEWFSNKMYDKNSIESQHLVNICLKQLCFAFDGPMKFTFQFKDCSKLKFKQKDFTDHFKPVMSPFSYLKDTIHLVANDQAMYLRISKYGKYDKRKGSFSFVKDSLSQYNWLILDFRNQHIDYVSRLILDYKKRANHLNAKPDFNSIIDDPFKDDFNFIPINLLDLARSEIEYFDFPPKLIVLVNENTRSAPERHLLPLHDAGLITIVGQPTAGTASFTNKILLPSGIRFSITSGRTKYKTGAAYQDNALQPDYKVDNSLSNQDLYLQKALEIIANEKN